MRHKLGACLMGFVLCCAYGCNSTEQASLDGGEDSRAIESIPPEQQACCTACQLTGNPCQPNGCFNGYYCNAANCRCLAPPHDGGTPGEDSAPADLQPPDATTTTDPASLRITEINVKGDGDLIELVVTTAGLLDGIQINEKTNSDFSFSFPNGYTVAENDVLMLHLGGSCTDSASDPSSCGDVAPFTSAAWDFSAPGSLTYSGKVFEVLAPDQTPMDGVPFVESHGVVPASYVAAVMQLQSAGLWAATPACIDDPSTGLAKDRYCRNISVLWDNLQSDKSNSVMRIAGSSPLDVPGDASQWSAALPASWGTY